MSSSGPSADSSHKVTNVNSSGDGPVSIGTTGDNTTIHMGDKRPPTRVPWLTASAWLVMTVTIGFLTFAVAQWPGGPRTQYVWFYVLTALAVLISGAAALYPRIRTDQPRDTAEQAGVTRQRRIVRTVLVATAALCLGGGALAWVDVDRTGEVAVELSITGRQPVGEKGGIVMVAMERPTPGDVRDKLRLTLAIRDEDQNAPTCVGKVTATITAVTPGVTPHTSEVPARSTVDFDLGGRVGAVEFAVAVRPETGCSMRLAQARGTLHDG
ncbi:hypothetical protein SRB5_10970 [Streptomyces sp. RB5]|uniref:Uncharacterized protein n=1 Tax=Streptomyces smaragdinus TaxID=2585196 RepID=A0A7K0CC52_9ACTN|nr:hypothetical protein [Streptomyces smaragdinus]MQY10983.1 hypothetical protein [Streptomyces smaragdinus]